MSIEYPEPFLEKVVELFPPPIDAAGFCAGYEGGVWRCTQLADHLFNWIPFTALNQEHQLTFSASNFVQMLKLAAAHIYNTKKTQSRGELGELLLHLISVLHFNSIPVICKLVLKTSSNETVKGFDGIHMVPRETDFELWLGESKFYTDPKAAIREAIASVKDHILPSFLNAEKAMVYGHISPSLPNRDRILHLFKAQTSGDALVNMSVFPILIAYQSDALRSFTAITNEYRQELEGEIRRLQAFFCSETRNIQLRFRLIFVPIGDKSALIASFDRKLGAFL